MTALETAAAGVIAAGFDGTQFDESLPKFGAYVLFARNGMAVEPVRALCDALLHHCAPGEPPPLIAIDQEGGRVARLRAGVERIPAMMALGAAGDLELALRAGEQTAFDLRRAGCSMNLAPVLDLALDPHNTVIGNRSFGAEPDRVAGTAGAFATGMQRQSLLCCGKHYPGHGSTATDSHRELPRVETEAATLRTRDLVPFAALAHTLPAMMSAHAVYAAFDSDQPATTSEPLIRLLRRELGFGGAYLTDCLEMGATGEPDVRHAIAALRAGADLLLFSSDLARAVETAQAIVAAVREGRLSEARLRAAYARVLAMRQRAPQPIDLDTPAPHPGVGREIARRAVTLVRGVAHADPVSSIVVSFELGTFDGAAGAAPAQPAHRTLKHEAPALVQVEWPGTQAGADRAPLLGQLAESGRRPIVLARRAHLYPAQAAAIDDIVRAYPDAVVVSTLEPFDLAVCNRARHLLAAYGDDAASIGGLADVLFGRTLPEGRIPVEAAIGL
jgi:beta-N-acetylhexosaminidase